MAHDFYADTFDTIDGKHWLYAEANPERKCEVVTLLDYLGEETDDPEEAAGGVVKIAEECYTVFSFDPALNEVLHV